MAWSIFTDGGGSGVAKTWAQDLLKQLGAPDTTATEQFVYDWEVSEGGGGKYNPLNQGPVPGHPELTTTGSQYGGGAADFASWQAGLTGAVDYINMSNYTQVKKALMAGDAVGARSALIASPWAASHYGNGASFSSAALPGQASALPAVGGGVSDASVVTAGGDACSLLFGPLKTACENTRTLSSSGSGGSLLAGIVKSLGVTDLGDLLERFGLILLGALFILIGVIRFTQTGQSVAKTVGMPVKAHKTGVKESNRAVKETEKEVE